MIAFCILLFAYVVAMTIIILVFLYKLETKLENVNTKRTEYKRKTHPSIAKSNYNSILAGRKSIPGYDKYKNKNGLYEPVTPRNGIRIKKKED